MVAGVVIGGIVLIAAGCQTGETRPLQPPVAPSLGPTRAPDDLEPPGDLRAYPAEDDLPAPPPDGPLVLSVEQAVFLALQNNRGLRVEQYRPMIVGAFEEIERSIYDPRVRAELSASWLRRQQTDPATETVFDVESERHFGELGISRFFPTGTDFGIDLSHVHTDSDRAPEQHSPRLGLTLNQALLRGASVQANLASIRQARLDTLASEYELRGFAELLAADVEQTFWEYALAAREIEIFQSSVDLAEQQLSETQRRVDVGVVARTELAAARAEQARRNEDLINAQSRLEQVRLTLLRLINPVSNDGWEREIELLDEITVLDVELDPVTDHMQLARRMRPDLNEARLRIDQGTLEVIRTRDGLLPRLDFFLTLGKTGFADSFGTSYRELIEGSGYDLVLGLNFEYPLGNRLARADHRRARLTQQQAAESLHNLTQLVDLDVRSAYVEAERTRAQVAATRATRELRDETLRVETAKFRVGDSTAFLVAQAQRDLLESQIAEARALVNHRQALIDLYRLEGSLLLRRAIDAPGAKLLKYPEQ